jgi:hypothetical protein
MALSLTIAWPLAMDRPLGAGEANYVPVELITEISDRSNVTAAAPVAGQDLRPTTEGSPQEVNPPTPEEAEPIPSPEPAPKKKAPPKKRSSLEDFDPSKMVDRSNPKAGDGATTSGAPTIDPRTRFGVGDATGLTASEIDAIALKMKDCWRSSKDMREADRLYVQLRLVIGPDGRLMREPDMLRPRARPSGDQPMIVAVENAQRAVRLCEPFPVAPGRQKGAQFTFNFYARN